MTVDAATRWCRTLMKPNLSETTVAKVLVIHCGSTMTTSCSSLSLNHSSEPCTIEEKTCTHVWLSTEFDLPETAQRRGVNGKRLLAHQVVEELGGRCDGVLGDLGLKRHPLVVVPREQGRVERLLGAYRVCKRMDRQVN